MTYAEKFIERFANLWCPREHLGENAPDLDCDTYTTPIFDTGERGCRGITCVECWNQEVEG